MKQETISLLENPGYGKFTIRTLKRLAAAFDVVFYGRFVPFSSLVKAATDLSPSDLAVPGYDNDSALHDLEQPANSLTQHYMTLSNPRIP